MNKMIVVVRNDLSASYKMVQGSHALAQYALDYPELFRSWTNETLIFLSVPNLIELRKRIEFITRLTIPFSIFFEPDLDNQETAFCYKFPEEFIFADLITGNLPLA